jgi:hypothetical protein
VGDVKKLPLTGSLKLKSALVVDATQSGGAVCCAVPCHGGKLEAVLRATASW